MDEIKPLSTDLLCWRCAPEQFTFESTEDLEDLAEFGGMDGFYVCRLRRLAYTKGR